MAFLIVPMFYVRLFCGYGLVPVTNGPPTMHRSLLVTKICVFIIVLMPNKKVQEEMKGGIGL